MNNISTQVMDIINQLAEKLGVASEKIYPVLMKQAQYHATMDIVWIIGLSIAAILLIVLTVFAFKEVSNAAEMAGVVVFLIVLTCVVIFSIGSCVAELIQINMNPDYFVFEMVKKLIN